MSFNVAHTPGGSCPHEMSSDDDDAHGDGAHHGSGDATTSTVMKWSLAKKVCHPSQRALGWDWTFFKLSQFVTFDEAQAYMTRKPVPFVSYQGRYFVVDHHHTLVGSTRHVRFDPFRFRVRACCTLLYISAFLARFFSKRFSSKRSSRSVRLRFH